MSDDDLLYLGSSADGGTHTFAPPEVLQQMLASGITPDGMGEALARILVADPKLLPEWTPHFNTPTPGPITPRQVLDLQGDLAVFLEPERDGRRSPLAAYLDTVAMADMGAIGVGSHEGKADVTVSRLVFEHILSGRAIRVGASMNEELLLRCHDTGLLSPSTTLGEDVAPIRHRGFAVFEEPLWLDEVRSRRQVVHAISWGFLQFATEEGGGHGRGWLVTMWADLTRDIDEVVKPLVEEEFGIKNYIEMFGRWSPVMCFPLGKGRSVGSVYAPLSEAQLVDIAANDQIPNHQTQRPERVVAALWQLLGETIATDATVVAERPSSTKSVGRTRKSVRPEVTVCVLRRPSRPTMHPGTGKKRETRTWVEGGYTQTFWTGPGRSIPVKRVVGGHWSVSNEDLPIKNRPRVDDLRR